MNSTDKGALFFISILGVFVLSMFAVLLFCAFTPAPQPKGSNVEIWVDPTTQVNYIIVTTVNGVAITPRIKSGNLYYQGNYF